MSLWKKIVISFVITFAVGSVYLYVVFRHRSAPGVGQKSAQQQHLTADQLAVVREEFPMHFSDVQDLEGKRVWMKNGYSMPYYPYRAGRVEWRKPAGLIPAARELDMKKAIKARAPASIHDNIEHGSHQVLVVFTLPGSQDEYATPVGFQEGSNDEHYYDDLLFYYDDPHTIYSNWPTKVWAAIDAHQVKPGMSELQTQMAIGMKMQPDGESAGNRTVDYNVNGKHVVVKYEHDKATNIQTR